MLLPLTLHVYMMLGKFELNPAIEHEMLKDVLLSVVNTANTRTYNWS